MGWEFVRYKKDDNGEDTDTVDTSYRDTYKVPELYSFGNDVVSNVHLKAIWVKNNVLDIKAYHHFLDLNFDEKKVVEQRLPNRRAGSYTAAVGSMQGTDYLLISTKDELRKLEDKSESYSNYKELTSTLNPVGRTNTYTQVLRIEPTEIKNPTTGKYEPNPDAKVNVFHFYYRPFRKREYKVNYIDERGKEEIEKFFRGLELEDINNLKELRELLEDEEFKNAVDLLFEELERDEPNHFAVRQYKKYKLAAGKTAKSILISCGARLAPFDIAELRELMSYDEMELDMIGDQRTALFIVISDTDDTFNFVVAMMYSQLFNLLCDRADDVHHGRLPYHVRILCDEFANIGQIPKFDKLIATIRSREISASIILQSQSQLKTIYKDAAETITGNCDTMLFLGGKESTTLKEISETLGKETIDLYNTSDTRGQSRSYGLNYQKTGKELMSRDELAVMDGNKCILQLRGVRPFYSDKFDITKHKRYQQLSDYDKKNEFHVEEYMKHQMEVRLSPEEAFDLYVYEGSELEKQSNSENEGTEHVT